MKLAVALSTLLAIGNGQNTLAEDKPDGNAFLKQCNATVRQMEALDIGHDLGSLSEQQDAAYCLGYINGFVEADEHNCPPSVVTMRQYVRIVIKFLNDHPEKLHLGRARLLSESLGAAFPCQK